MGPLLLLIGMHELWTAWRTAAARPGFLGAGLVLAGLRETVDPGTFAHGALTLAALPVLAVALGLAWRDGSLAATFACWRRRRT